MVLRRRGMSRRCPRAPTTPGTPGVMAGRTATATITRRALFVQVRAALRDEHGPDVPIPNERDLYRLAARMDRGLHTFGAARTRRRTANRPDRPFTSGVTLRPGEHVQIDHQHHRHSVSIRGRCDPAGGVDDRGGRRDPQHPDRCGRTDDESGGCGRGAATPNRSVLYKGQGAGHSVGSRSGSVRVVANPTMAAGWVAAVSAFSTDTTGAAGSSGDAGVAEAVPAG